MGEVMQSVYVSSYLGYIKEEDAPSTPAEVRGGAGYCGTQEADDGVAHQAAGTSSCWVYNLGCRLRVWRYRDQGLELGVQVEGVAL